MASIKPISNIIIHPVLKPWDFKFNQRDSSLILVHLKNGDMIGGLFDFNSFASSYPADEQLYLEKVWKINENGNFEKPINRSKGIIIMRDEIAAVEFFAYDELTRKYND